MQTIHVRRPRHFCFEDGLAWFVLTPALQPPWALRQLGCFGEISRPLNGLCLTGHEDPNTNTLSQPITRKGIGILNAADEQAMPQARAH